MKKVRRANKNTLTWESKFKSKLVKLHGNHWKTTFHRLMKKSSTLKSTLKRRSKEYEVICNISLKEIRESLYQAYGQDCKYCTSKLVLNNIVCDHITPLSLGGGSIPRNLQMICARCNTRKGPLTDEQFSDLLAFLLNKDELVSGYVLRKLARADVM